MGRVYLVGAFHDDDEKLTWSVMGKTACQPPSLTPHLTAVILSLSEFCGLDNLLVIYSQFSLRKIGSRRKTDDQRSLLYLDGMKLLSFQLICFGSLLI